MTRLTRMDLPTPNGAQLKAARLVAGLSQVEAAELMGYPVQPGSRGGLQSRTWQALESVSDERQMPAPVFALFLLLTHQHPQFSLVSTPRMPHSPQEDDHDPFASVHPDPVEPASGPAV